MMMVGEGIEEEWEEKWEKEKWQEDDDKDGGRGVRGRKTK